MTNRFRQHQISGDNKMSDMHSEVKLKAFESERSQLVYDEAMRNLKVSQLDNEKVSMKLDVRPCILAKRFYFKPTSYCYATH